MFVCHSCLGAFSIRTLTYLINASTSLNLSTYTVASVLSSEKWVAVKPKVVPIVTVEQCVPPLAFYVRVFTCRLRAWSGVKVAEISILVVLAVNLFSLILTRSTSKRG